MLLCLTDGAGISSRITYWATTQLHPCPTKSSTARPNMLMQTVEHPPQSTFAILSENGNFAAIQPKGQPQR